MAAIEMNTITQDAVVSLAEYTAALEALSYLIDAASELRPSDGIGIAIIIRRLADGINNEVNPFIKPIITE